MNSTIIQIDSRDRVAGTPADFAISLGDRNITDSVRVCPIGCSFTHVFPNINEVRSNNSLKVKVIDYNNARYTRFFLQIASWDSHPESLFEMAPRAEVKQYNVIFDIDYQKFRELQPTVIDARISSLKENQNLSRKDMDLYARTIEYQLKLALHSMGCTNTDYISIIPFEGTAANSSNLCGFRILRSASMVFRLCRFEDMKIDLGELVGKQYPAEFKELDGYDEYEWLKPCKFPLKVANSAFSVGQQLVNEPLGVIDKVAEGWVGVWANNIGRAGVFAVENSELKRRLRTKYQMTTGYIDVEIPEQLCFMGVELDVDIATGSYNVEEVLLGLNSRLNQLIEQWLLSINSPRLYHKDPVTSKYLNIALDNIRLITKIDMYQLSNQPYALGFYIAEEQELARQLGLYTAASDYVGSTNARKYTNTNDPLWRTSLTGRGMVDLFPVSGLLLFAPGLVNANTINSKGESLAMLARISNLGSFGQRIVWENNAAFELFLQPSASNISTIRFYLTDLDYNPVKMDADWNLTVAVFSVNK